MENPGQHNLSIALRHILQQIVDSTNPNGHKNTDMTLPHDGYIQRLSWYFECDKCHYKAFYSHEMESHKRVCYYSIDMKALAKKRKLAAPKRVSSSTHPPTEDSDQDSIPAIHSTKNNFPFSQESSIVTPSPKPMVANTSGNIHLTKTTESNVISMEPTDLEFDTGLSSPDYDTPTIPEMDNETRKTLDFDAAPVHLDMPAQQSHSQSQHQQNSLDAFDPDILEIKIEIDDPNGSANKSNPPPLEKAEAVPHTDVVFPGTSDPSIDSMMSLFGPQPTHHTPSHQHIVTQHLPATPVHSHYGNMHHHPPGLSIGHVTSLKKPMFKPTPSPMAGGAIASTAKVKSNMSMSAHVSDPYAAVKNCVEKFDVDESTQSSQLKQRINTPESYIDMMTTLRNYVKDFGMSANRALKTAGKQLNTVKYFQNIWAVYLHNPMELEKVKKDWHRGKGLKDLEMRCAQIITREIKESLLIAGEPFVYLAKDEPIVDEPSCHDKVFLL